MSTEYSGSVLIIELGIDTLNHNSEIVSDV